MTEAIQRISMLFAVWLARMALATVCGLAAGQISDARAQDVTPYPHETMWADLGAELTYRWCAGEADSYDVEFRLFPSNTLIFAATTELPEYTWKAPNVGHFTFRVRARLGEEVSDWVESHTQQNVLDPPAPGCSKRNVGWFLYIDVPAPGGGGIE